MGRRRKDENLTTETLSTENVEDVIVELSEDDISADEPKKRRKRRGSTEEVEEFIEKIEDLDVIDEYRQDFNEYSEEVNAHRAFSYLRAGLKPVVAHIIWAMYAHGRASNKPYTKSAKCEGDVTSYSPHGSAYGAMARLAQDFCYHIPYIDGHGSFGSAIGGPAFAASRYTEMRLSKFIEDVLLYNEDLLDMGMNYLDEDPEPILSKWVALLPLLYITNTEGVGYPVSNSWSSGNLYEFRDQLVNYLKTGTVDCSQIYPDFPTGGIIVNKSDMKALYETGKGTIKLRGNTEIVGDTIKITSLPYQVYPEDIMEDIKNFIIKNAQNNPIVEFSNRCDKNGILIEIECQPGTAEYTRALLFKRTHLQVSISDEHKAIIEGVKPKLITFYEYMKEFVDSNIELVKKEAQLNLNKVNDRLEVVNGLISALDIIDLIIATIKKCKSMAESKIAIMNIKKYTFTERQADEVVHMPLGRLANLEQIKLQDEKKDLEKRKEELEDLLVNEKSQKKYFLKRFNTLIDKYAWERKTQVIDEVETSEDGIKPIRLAKPEQLKAKKEYMIVLTSENCLKRVDVMKFRQTDEDEKCIKVQGNQKVTMLSNKGNMFKVWSNAIDKCLPAASGTPIETLRPESANEKIIGIYSEDVSQPYVYFVTKEGYGKMGDVEHTIRLSKMIGATVCGLKSDTDEIISIKILNDGENIEITTNNRKETIKPGKPQGRGSGGKRIIVLKKSETITEVHSV